MKTVAMLGLLLLPTGALAQVSVDWVRDTRGVAIALDADENVYTVDYEYNPGGDISLTKRAADGTPLWTVRHDQTDPTRWEKATWVATDPQGNVFVSGTSMSGYSNPVNAASLLMKYSPSGALLWRRVYENTFDGSYTTRCLTDAAGAVHVLGLGGPDGPVTKVKTFAPDGTALWVWVDRQGIGAPVNLKHTPDGGLLVVARGIYGSINGYAKLDRDGRLVWSLAGVQSLTVGDAAGDAAGNTYVVHGVYATNGGTTVRKLSPTGAVIWSRDFALAGFRVEVGPDGLPVVCGFPNSGQGGAAFIKVAADGGLVWSNLDADGPLGLLLHARLLIDAEGSAYLAAGTLFEMAVCKVTAAGAPAWTQTVRGSYANSIELGDGAVYVVGGTTARFAQSGRAIAGVPGVATAGPLLAAAQPNPAAGATLLRYRLPVAGPVTLTVHDVAGRVVAAPVDAVEEAGEHAVRLDTRGLADGVYHVRLRHGAAWASRRLVVCH